MLIAHITDSHVLAPGQRLAGRMDTAAAFDRLIASLKAQPVQPDLVLFSGDLAEDATSEEYAHVSAGLRHLGLPVLAVPGNHDRRAPMLAALPGMVRAIESGHLCLAEQTRGPLIIGLDTVIEGAPEGELCEARLEWLAGRLNEARGREVLIFMHHPPITTGLKDMDSMGLLAGREALASLIADHGKVCAILCGHMHRAIMGCCGGAPVRVAPAASLQIAFDLRDGVSFDFSGEPPQYMMHRLDRAGGLVSHVISV